MWRDVELRELRIFLVLGEELHFGRTAERLGISQPGVSEAVRVLESRLGVKVFDRTSRPGESTHARPQRNRPLNGHCTRHRPPRGRAAQRFSISKR